MDDFDFIMSREEYNLLSKDKQLQASFLSMHDMMIVKDREKIYYTKPHTMTLIKLNEKRKRDVEKHIAFFVEAANKDKDVATKLQEIGGF